MLSDVADKIKDGQDIFGRDAKFVMRTIDKTYPEYLQKHQDEYAHLILQEEHTAHKELRHIKRGIRKVYEKGIRGVKKIGRVLLRRK